MGNRFRHPAAPINGGRHYPSHWFGTCGWQGKLPFLTEMQNPRNRSAPARGDSGEGTIPLFQLDLRPVLVHRQSEALKWSAIRVMGAFPVVIEILAAKGGIFKFIGQARLRSSRIALRRLPGNLAGKHQFSATLSVSRGSC